MATKQRLPPLGKAASHTRYHLAAAQYFEEQHIRDHFTKLTQQLLIHQPSDALRFMYNEIGRQMEEREESNCLDCCAEPLDSGSCLLKVHAEYQGPGRKRQQTFTSVVATSDQMMRHSAEKEAVKMMHAVFWDAAEEPSIHREENIEKAAAANAPAAPKSGGLCVTQEAAAADGHRKETWLAAAEMCGSVPKQTQNTSDMRQREQIELAADRNKLVDWLQDLKIEEAIANRLLPKPLQSPPPAHTHTDTDTRTHDSPMHHLLNLNTDNVLARLAGVDTHIQSIVCHALADLAAHSQGAADTLEEEGNTGKFAWAGEGWDALFGDTDFFRKGLNDLIGLPGTNIAEAMETEHKRGESSNKNFTTSNYGTETTPSEEWY